MYLVMKLRYWKDLQLEQTGIYRLPFPVKLEQSKDGSIGFVEVYSNYKKALKAAGSPRLVKKVEAVSKTDG